MTGRAPTSVSRWYAVPTPFVGFACLVAEGEYRGGGLEGRVHSQCCVRVVVAAVECLLFVRLTATSAVHQSHPHVILTHFVYSHPPFDLRFTQLALSRRRWPM